MRKNNIQSTLMILSIASLSLLIIVQSSSQVHADVLPPKKQIKIGIDQTDIICKANLVKTYRINADSTDCFTPSTAQKLMDLGIAKEIPKDSLEAKKSFKQNPPIGTVTGLSTIKQFGTEGKLSSNLRVVEYVHVFDVCANDRTIRAPEVLVTSDSEAKTVKLAQKIIANTCYTSSAKIKASDPNSISASLTNKGAISDRLTELETKIAETQQKLATLKKSLSDLTKDPTMPNEETRKKITETTNEISNLRTELNLAKGELNKYLFTLYSPQQLKTSDFKQKMTFTGNPLESTSANIMSVSKQTLGTKDESSKIPSQGLHNVIFEACAGKEVVRAPEIKISSDIEEKIIRISERIAANSCQKSTAKINASEANSITIEIANRSDISIKITELERKIEELSNEQGKYQMELNKLAVQPEKPADYEQNVTELSDKIIQLRNEIRDAKFQLHGNMYEVYKNP